MTMGPTPSLDQYRMFKVVVFRDARSSTMTTKWLVESRLKIFASRAKTGCRCERI